MKKLLITAIGAAVAFGAFADAVRFEESGVGPITALSQLPGGTNFWSEPAGATNTYAIGAAGSVTAPLSIASGESSPTNALDIKTTFGKPLSLNAVSGGTPMDINDGLYFDSLVKFTVCDADQNTAYAAYDDAKIVMWLEQTEDESKTNLIVQAGYLSWDNAKEKYVSTPTNYVCALPGGFNIDAWHRVTIKAIADITTGYDIPGFAIYLDQSGDTVTQFINAGTAAMWDGETLESELTEAAAYLNGRKALFPSRKLGSGQDLTSVGFDGTGSITDLIFTENGPAFAQDYVAPKASVKIGEADAEDYGSLAEAVAAVNGASAGVNVAFKLAKSMTLAEPLEFTSSANVVFDFYGQVLENTTAVCAITNAAGAITFIDSGVGGGITCTESTAGAVYVKNATGTGATFAGGIFRSTAAPVEWALMATSKIHFTGGSYAVKTAAFDTRAAADGKVFQYNNETALYDVVDKPAGVAEINGESYATLEEALTAATAGQTIKLLDNVEATAVSTAAGTLDLNGKTLTLSGATAITFTGTGAKTLKGGDLMGVYHELTVTTLGNEGLTLDGMTFHASVKPVGTNGLFKATNCQFLCDFDKTGAAFTDGSTADVHSYGVLFFGDSQFAQADIVNSYFDQGRRAAVQASFAGDLYFYGNTVVADKLTSRVDGAATRYPALQTMTHGRVFIENNTFSGQYLGEAFCLYNKGTYRTTDKAIVFSGNTVSNGVNYLWGIYDVDKSGDAALVAPNLYFGANTVDANVDTTGCIYKTTVDGVDMNGVTYSHTPATLALPAGVDSVYAWTHAAGATDFYVNGTAAANLNSVAANDTVVAVPGATVTEPAAIILTADATLKNKYTAGAAVAQITGGAKYATLKDAVDAADTGDTVTVLADCTVAEQITFTKGITVSNDYTVTVANDGSITYAYRVINGTTTPVTLCGTGTFTESGTASGSQFLVGFTVTRYETAPTAGSLVLDGCTVTNGQSNVIKVENGTFTMNSGTIDAAGLRGVKADGEDAANSATVTINGGTINSTKAAVAVSSKADKGAATATITGGTIAGPVTDEASAVALSSITIPGTSTAKFKTQPSATFVESGYETVLSDGWYVVKAVPPPGINPADATPSADVTAASAEAAIEAVEVTTPTEAGSTPEAKAAYKDLFTYTAVETSAGSGVYTVTMTGIKDEVQTAVDTTAAAVLDGTAESVTIPAGLFYKITPSTALPISGEATTGQSTGAAIPVTKPGTTQGFIEVKLGTQTFAE